MTFYEDMAEIDDILNEANKKIITVRLPSISQTLHDYDSLVGAIEEIISVSGWERPDEEVRINMHPELSYTILAAKGAIRFCHSPIINHSVASGCLIMGYPLIRDINIINNLINITKGNRGIVGSIKVEFFDGDKK